VLEVPVATLTNKVGAVDGRGLVRGKYLSGMIWRSRSQLTMGNVVERFRKAAFKFNMNFHTTEQL
jgi:hypothetical protein